MEETPSRKAYRILTGNEYREPVKLPNEHDWTPIIAFSFIILAVVLLIVSMSGCNCYADTHKRITNMIRPNCTPIIGYTCSELADAIYIAEGGKRTKHPYGILKHYRRTDARTACINTIHSNIRRWLDTDQVEPFIHYLARHYAPIGVSNDKNNLNINWERNVLTILAKNHK